MLLHNGKTWSTSCDRCNAPVEILGAPDKRRSKSGVELKRASEFLISIGWTPLHRKNAGYMVAWRCKECVDAIKSRAQSSKPHSTAGLDMNPSPRVNKAG